MATRVRRARGRGRPPDPWAAAALDRRRSYRKAMGILARARGGALTHLSEERKRDLLARFDRLMQLAGAPPQQISALKGQLDEALRTPSDTRGQQSWRAGGPLLPGMSTAGTARPDYPQTVRRADGTAVRVHVNLKSDRIHNLSLGEAVGRARRYTNDAVRNAIQLPVGEPIVIRYMHTPAPEVVQAILAEHFRAGSPIVSVHFGTTAHRNPNLAL